MSQHSGPFQNLFQGVVRWADEYTPLRFTARQADVYAQNIRAYASAGMRLECDTDASAIHWGFRVSPGSMHDLYCFDLTVDGELFARTEISALSLEGASFARPVRHEHRLLCLGDSITQGYTGHFPSMHYALPCRPAIITVAYGTNDWGKKDKKRFRADAHAFLRMLTSFCPDAFVMLLTPIWRLNSAVPKTPDFFLWGCNVHIA